MIKSNSEFFIEKPIAKDNERVSRGLVYLSSRFRNILKIKNKMKSNDGFELKEVWNKITKSDISTISFPQNLTNRGVLNIIVKNSACIPFIRYNSDDFINQINLFYGKEVVKKINIKNIED